MTMQHINYFQFNVKIDTSTNKELVDFLVIIRHNRQLNAVVRKALYLYMQEVQHDLFTPAKK